MCGRWCGGTINSQPYGKRLSRRSVHQRPSLRYESYATRRTLRIRIPRYARPRVRTLVRAGGETTDDARHTPHRRRHGSDHARCGERCGMAGTPDRYPRYRGGDRTMLRARSHECALPHDGDTRSARRRHPAVRGVTGACGRRLYRPRLATETRSRCRASVQSRRVRVARSRTPSILCAYPYSRITMKIQSHDTDTRVFVVAEIGNNHEG